MRVFIALLLLFAAITFGLGITLPLIQFEKLYFFEETPSLLSIIGGLWAEGDVALSLVVLLFSVVFPLVKLAATFVSAFALGTDRPEGTLGAILPLLAKWSMMDVLLVALVVFAAKTSGFATAFAQAGLWFYAGSAISGALAAGLLKRSGKSEKSESVA